MDAEQLRSEAQELLAMQGAVRQRLMQMTVDIREAAQIGEDDRAQILDRLWLARSEVERAYNALLWLTHLAR